MHTCGCVEVVLLASVGVLSCGPAWGQGGGWHGGLRPSALPCGRVVPAEKTLLLHRYCFLMSACTTTTEGIGLLQRVDSIYCRKRSCSACGEECRKKKKESSHFSAIVMGASARSFQECRGGVAAA